MRQAVSQKEEGLLVIVNKTFFLFSLREKGPSGFYLE